MELPDREQIEQLPAVTILKWVGLGSLVVCLPYQLVMGLAAAVLHKFDKDAIFCVLTADHVIEPEDVGLHELRDAIGRLAAGETPAKVVVNPARGRNE